MTVGREDPHAAGQSPADRAGSRAGPVGVMALAVKPAPAPERRLILPASALLDAAIVQQLHAGSGSSATYFDAVYRPLLHAVAEYLQQLPDPAQPAITGLDARLHTAATALRHRRGRLLPPGAPAERLAQDADLWTYSQTVLC